MIDYLPEPWEWGVREHNEVGQSNDITIRPAGEFPHGMWIADVGRRYDDVAKANARRIVAAVNACAGVDTNELESMSLLALRDENARLRAALTEIAAIREYAWTDKTRRMVDEAQRALVDSIGSEN